MKKLFYIKIIVLVTILAMLPYQKIAAKGALEKGFTLKFAYVMPAANFGQMPSTGNFFGIGLTPYPLRNAGSGFGLQLGTMFFINGIKLGDQMKIGVDVTWLSLNYSTNTHATPSLDGETKFYQAHFSMEVGPSFSYSPVEKLALDASFKLSPTVGLMGGTFEYQDNSGSLPSIEKANVGGAGFGLRFTPAFYVRYSVLLLGFEYNIGNLGMAYSASSGVAKPASGKVPYSTARLVFGFKF